MNPVVAPVKIHSGICTLKCKDRTWFDKVNKKRKKNDIFVLH